MFKSEEYKWVVMDKKRTVIAKGAPGLKYLIPVDDEKDQKRTLYYSTKNRAANCQDGSFMNNGNYQNYKYHVEPVKVTIEEVPSNDKQIIYVEIGIPRDTKALIKEGFRKHNG